MSADNGIYILKLKDQCRVAHLQAIDNIYWSEFESDITTAKRYNREIIPTRVVEMWGDCKFTRSYEKALEIANNWCNHMWICEYGVNTITYDKTWKQVLQEAMKFAKKEIELIKSKNADRFYAMDKLQKMADGVYLSEWLNREQYYKDLRKHDCGYWSVCYDKGCKCHIDDNVDGFDNEVYLQLKSECRC